MLVRFFVLRQSIQTEDGQNIHVLVVDHEPNVTEAARRLERILGYLPPQDKIDEDLGDLLQRLQVDVLCPQARDDDRVEALLIQDFLQVLLIFREQ